MFEWTDARIRLAVSLWTDETKTASDVAQAVGTSRNAVIGKMHRLGLMKNQKNIPEELRMKDEPSPAPVVEPPKPLDDGRTQDAVTKVVSPRPMKNTVDITDEGIPFMKGLPSSGVCKFPLWSDNSSLPIEEKRVCGKPSPGGVWCTKHTQMVFEVQRKR